MPPEPRKNEITSCISIDESRGRNMKSNEEIFENECMQIISMNDNDTSSVSQHRKRKVMHAPQASSSKGAMSSCQQEQQEQQQQSKKDDYNIWKRLQLKRMTKFWTIKLAQVLCATYIIVLTFSNSPLGLVDPESGDIIDVANSNNTNSGIINIEGIERPVVAQGKLEKLCLAISRISAFSMYPVLVTVFLSKSKATFSFFNSTPLSLYMIQDSHELHTFAGKYIAFDVWIHSFFHVLRWINQGNLHLLFSHPTGLSGLIVLIATPLITFPMMYCKKSMPYEIRKVLHYLFYLFAIGMCFHVPTSAFPNGGFIAPILGFFIALYILDSIYVFFFMTEKIETTIFHVLPSGVQMTMAVSENFQKRGEQGGFAYVCLPWVDRNQWHAFSLFEHPVDPTKRQVFMQKAGNWTKAVHEALLQRQTVRPVWVQGPFASPYSNADAYDNQILVASGIGITPALSVIRAHKNSRRTNLIWAVRDAAMLEFFLEHLYLDHDGWNLIFYTGKKALNPALDELNTNVRIIKSRPDLHVVIPNILYGIERGIGLPEKYVPKQMALMEDLLVERLRELDDSNELETSQKLVELTTFAKNCGFVFTEVVNHLENKNDDEDEDGERSYVEHDSTSDDILFEPDVEMPSRTLDGSVVLQRLRDFAQNHAPSNCPPPHHRAMRRDSQSSSSCQNNGENFHWSLQPPTSLSLRSSRNVLRSTFTPWEKQLGASSYVKNLNRRTVLGTWGILYCGGSKPVENALRKISEEFGIALNCESFAW